MDIYERQKYFDKDIEEWREVGKKILGKKMTFILWEVKARFEICREEIDSKENVSPVLHKLIWKLKK